VARQIGCSGLRPRPGAGDIDGAIDHLKALRARHIDVAGIVSNATERAGVEAFIDAEFSGLERIVGALGVLREVTPRWLDAIAATGEIVSSRIVASALTSHGLSASWVDARKAIVTAADHTAAAPLWPETTKALQKTVDPELVRTADSRHRRFRRRHQGWNHDDAGARRIGLHGGDHRRLPRRVGDSDLDRR
jgi:hypothetical protein